MEDGYIQTLREHHIKPYQWMGLLPLALLGFTCAMLLTWMLIAMEKNLDGQTFAWTSEAFLLITLTAWVLFEPLGGLIVIILFLVLALVQYALTLGLKQRHLQATPVAWPPPCYWRV